MKDKENYGMPVTLDELKGHYKMHFLKAEQFIELVENWHEEEIKKIKNNNSCRWVKFEEKEPPIGETVIVFSVGRGYESDYEYEGDGVFYNNNEDKTRDVLFSKTDTKYNITHWFSVPRLY